MTLLGAEFFSKRLMWTGTSPVPYSAYFTLNRIMPGVDNFRYDVHLSPVFCESVSKIIMHLVIKVAEAEEDIGVEFDWNKEKEEFKKLCKDLMLDAVKRAKLGDEGIQIDYLAQVAVTKYLIQEISNQFEELLIRLNNQVWEYESTDDAELVLQTLSLKDRVLAIRHKKSIIITLASKEIFQYLLEAQKPLQERREANYGAGSLLKDDLFTNPILHIDRQRDDYFMLEQYVLLGNRIDDPDRYETLLALLKELLGRIRINPAKDISGAKEESRVHGMEKSPERKLELANQKIEGWLREVQNVDLLLDHFKTAEEIAAIKKQRSTAKDDLQALVLREKEQKRIFKFFHERFDQKKLITRVIASFEIKPIYLEYCPPLVPQQVLQYIISDDARKSVNAQLKRLKVYYGKTVSLVTLKKAIMKMGRLKLRQRHTYFLEFLRGFFRYHRDLENFKLIKKALDRINLVTDDKTVALSKTNHTLYEFLLPHEQVFELDTKPVTSHVIIKADVRGATVITRQLDESGLNPASFFSLNFFNPISEIVSLYGALKVFIEGDAIILAILERKDDEVGKYCVSRACGLAINMLNIIQRYNAKSIKYKLPILEIGVGICYQNAPPNYLLDGKKKIMISPAINLADRFSSCHKTLRRLSDRNKRPFNLYVYQTAGEQENTLSEDEIVLRYNVNGIELNKAGFIKLTREIDLKAMNCLIPEIRQEPMMIYTGKFPLVTGVFQRLIVREEWVQELNPVNLQSVGKVNRKYYEVCTHSALKEYIEKKERALST
jgi:hypothetical protein